MISFKSFPFKYIKKHTNFSIPSYSLILKQRQISNVCCGTVFKVFFKISKL